MTVTVYRSTDGSAPVLTGQSGSWIQMLKACLVDGYGAKAAAGWTMPYTNAKGQATATTISFTSSGRVINSTGTPNYLALGFYSNEIIQVSGSASNNGYYTISATIPTSNSITLLATADNNLVNEGTGASVTIKTVIGTVKQTTISFVPGTPDTIHRSAGSFLTDGYQVGWTVTVSGAANGGNNTTWTIASVTASDLILTTNSAVTNEAAGATVTIISDSAHKAVFRQGGGNNRYFQFMNEGPHAQVGGGPSPSAAANSPCVSGWETMSAFNTGTNMLGSHIYGASCSKTGTSYTDTTGRNWVIVADNKTAYVMVQTGEAGVPTGWSMFMMGDITSYVTGDTWNTAIIAHGQTGTFSVDSTQYATYVADTATLCDNYVNYTDQGGFAHGMFRNYAGSVGVRTFALGVDGNGFAQQSSEFRMGAVTALPYPYAINSAFVLSPCYVKETDGTNKPIRGYLRGFWAPCHNAPASNNDTFSGTGTLAGKTFEVFRSRNSGTFIIETSNTWSA